MIGGHHYIRNCTAAWGRLRTFLRFTCALLQLHKPVRDTDLSLVSTFTLKCFSVFCAGVQSLATCCVHSQGSLGVPLWTGILIFKTTALKPWGSLWLIFPFSVCSAPKVQRGSWKGRHRSPWEGNKEEAVAQWKDIKKVMMQTSFQEHRHQAACKSLCRHTIMGCSWWCWEVRLSWFGRAEGWDSEGFHTSPKSHILDSEMIPGCSETQNLSLHGFASCVLFLHSR